MTTTDAEMAPLPTFSPGTVLRICRVDAEGDDAVRLKRLGLCVGRETRLVQVGDPLVLLVVGCRVGVSRPLAGLIYVTPSDPTDGTPPELDVPESK